MKKSDLEMAIESKEKELIELEEWIQYILLNGEKKYLISRGFAKHSDDCPKNSRMYGNNSYANIIDDCTYCEFLLARSYNLGNYDFPEQFIICGGKNNLKSKIKDVVIPFDRDKYIQENLKNYKHIYECEVCGMIYFDKKIFDCNYTDKKDLSTYTCYICGEKKFKKL